MPLPKTQHVLFGKSPLKQVIIQVRYPILPRFGESSFVAPFIEEVRRTYPKVNRQEQRSLVVSSSEGFSMGASETLWKLASRDGNCVTVLGENAITLEVSAHSSIDGLLEEFERVLRIACEKLEITERSRLGLRYINEFRNEEARNLSDWKPLLHDELLGFAASDILDGCVDRMTQEVRLKRDDGVLAIRHGLISGNGGEVKPDSRAAYLLDLDYYDSTEQELDIGQTVRQVRGYSDYMYEYFRWTLKEKLFRMLEPNNGSSH